MIRQDKDLHRRAVACWAFVLSLCRVYCDLCCNHFVDRR